MSLPALFALLLLKGVADDCPTTGGQHVKCALRQVCWTRPLNEVRRRPSVTCRNITHPRRALLPPSAEDRTLSTKYSDGQHCLHVLYAGACLRLRRYVPAASTREGVW
ncbi:hypothetical protein F5J12DRAFT_431006 [Pisolithus orientalis]|uniref:uncharacterized protein n=1 Tax=Pisolithus orientalis TaxID=936130 RepID=UPI0022259021|nr:uncharacterized protein F5J12DRAFT_431006 [Pisolithus orientalis]KAI5993161.1 hypothetical protein F5J12DRAFT_431006 [Pisolithus orientalis]